MTNPHRGSVATIAAVLATAFTPAFAVPPTTSTYFSQIEDVSPCTGAIILLTFEGTVRVHEVDSHFVAHYSGSVTTSDGGTGGFNAQFILQGDRVNTFHTHDMEIYANGQRIFFTGVFHTTLVGGQVTAEVANFKLECVGKP